MKIYKISLLTITLCCSAIFQLIGLIHLFLYFTNAWFNNIWFTSNFIFIVVSIILSVINYFLITNIRTYGIIYSLFIIKILLIIFTEYPSGEYFIIKLVLLCSLVLEIILYGKIWKNISFAVFSLIGTNLITMIDSKSLINWGVPLIQLSVSDMLLLFMYPLVIIILSSIIRLFERQNLNSEQIVERLKDGGANLAETNIFLQEQIIAIENEAVESERKRVSREIHDIVGHTLMTIILILKSILQMRLKVNKEVLELIEQMHEQARKGLEETRKALTILKDKKTIYIPLVNSIHKLIEVFKGTHVSIHVEFGNSPNDLGDLLNRIIYRFIQEGITNAIRHGNATEIKLYFWLENDILQVVIRDNGIGCKQFTSGIGLNGIGERMKQINGRFETRNTEYGFQLIAYIPIARDFTGNIET